MSVVARYIIAYKITLMKKECNRNR